MVLNPSGGVPNLQGHGGGERHLTDCLDAGVESGALAGRHESVPSIVIEPSASGEASTCDGHECGSHVGHDGVKSMARALDTSGVPPVFAKVLWPWIDIVEMATGGMGGRVRRTAENTVANLRAWISMTPPLEQALEDALRTSDALARELDLRDFLQSDARTEALLALNDLITWLQAAKQNAGSR